MRITLLTQHFPPETGAAQNRLAALARIARDEGIDITVLTAMPHYHERRVYEGYRGRFFMRDEYDGVTVLRAWVIPAYGTSRLRRFASYLSFMISSLIVGLLYAPPSDLLLWESPPLPLGMSAFVLARMRSAKLVTNISDLWPEGLVALGALQDGLAARFLTRLEEFLYCHSDLISGQSNSYVTHLQSRVPGANVVSWFNGGDPVSLSDDERAQSRADTRAEWGIPNSAFVVGTAGLIGISHDTELILSAAQAADDDTVKFVIVGDGPMKAPLMAQCTQRGIRNIKWIERQPVDRMTAVLSAFDCTVIGLRHIPLFRRVIPARLTESMAHGVPLLVAINGEAAEIVRNSRSGLVVPPEDPEALVASIERLRANPQLCRELGANGYRSVCDHYNRTALTRRYIDELRSLCE